MFTVFGPATVLSKAIWYCVNQSYKKETKMIKILQDLCDNQMNELMAVWNVLCVY